MAEIAFLSLTAAALLAAALLLDFVAHRRWFRRRQSLAGRVVLITGAAGGLGRQLALRFAREGATVALWDVRADALDEVFEWLTRTHKVAASAVRRTVVDVADRRAVERAAAELAHACGAVRVLVNNAAIVCGDALLAGSSADSLERTLRVNIEGAFWVVRALAAPMLAAGGGTVVTVGSVVAQLPSARLADYCASKAALGMLHACLRWELRGAPRGDTVRCLLVQPYLLDTPLFAGGAPGLFPRLLAFVLPPLSAAEVARRVVLGVQTGQERLVLPYILRWAPLILELLPTAAADALLTLAGARGEPMRGFRGRGEAEWAAMGAAQFRRPFS